MNQMFEVSTLADNAPTPQSGRLLGPADVAVARGVSWMGARPRHTEAAPYQNRQGRQTPSGSERKMWRSSLGDGANDDCRHQSDKIAC